MSTAYDRRLRRILMRSRKIDLNQLDEFDEKVKDSDKSLADLLLESNILSKQELLSLMAMATDIPPIDLTKVGPDVELMQKLNKESAEKYNAFPIALIGNMMTVALADPFEHATIESLEIVTECKIRPVLSTHDAITEAIAEKYKNLKAMMFDSDGSDEEFDEEENALFPEDDDDEDGGDEAVSMMVSSDFDEILDESLAGSGETDEEEQIDNEIDRGIIKLVNKIILDGYKRGVSDIHIEPYHGKYATVIRFRSDGDCYKYHHVPNQIKRALLSRLKLMAGLDIAERRLPQDGKIQMKKFVKNVKIELRLATIPTVGGNEDAVMRILAASKPIPLANMGFLDRNLEEFKKIVAYPYGLILVVGPTGSGKTTTLHSALGYINTPKRKIWTAEDPVEITQRGLRQVQTHAKIGFDFARAMRAFLRADPDVIMVGEMRDHETAAMGIEASLTGHLVLSTLHTNSAPETIVRLIDMGIDPFNFADALLGVLAQRLARRVCTNCAEEYHPTEEEYNAVKEEFGHDEHWGMHVPEYNEEMVLKKTVGCKRCRKTGYKGRLGVHEFLLNTDQLREIIQRKGKAMEVKQAAIGGGMTTLKQDGIIKCFQGITEMHAIRAVCM